ncbi:hypothetical protein T06_12985 [Trichinella sp. T6]|nr:hypothetical protein T06_12985 [Trichinella sp. T6]
MHVCFQNVKQCDEPTPKIIVIAEEQQSPHNVTDESLCLSLF